MQIKKLMWLAISFHLGVIIVVIHKNNKIIELSQQKQALEREFETLTKKRETFLHQLYTMKNPEEIKRYAQKELGMEKINLHAIKKITVS